MKASGGIVFEGVIDGNNGDNGYNTAQVALYRRSATALTNNDRPTGTLTYTFSTGRVSGASSYYNGWSQSIPETVAGTKLYVIMAIARSQSDTDDIAASDWSTPVEYVADGVNSAPVFIYKRNKTQPTDKPADGATYYFKKVGSTEAGTLSGTLNGWSTQIPATDSNHYPCWVRQAMAVSNGNTDVINASEWSDPATKLIEDGVSITSADVVFVLSDSGSTAPADSVTWKTSFAELDIKNTNASKFVWQAVKVVLSNGTTSYTGKQCLGKVSEFASITEQYALGTASAATGNWQDNTPPSAEKGKYLWTRTKLTYSDNSVGYSPSEAGQCVGYFGTDGKGISSADIMFCLGNSQTTAPGDSSFTATSFAELNIKSTDADKYVWQCIKTTYTSGNPTYSGKVCLGKVSDFASVTEQYALGTASAATGNWQDNTPPSAEKGKYLWTRTKLTYSGGGTTYVPSSSGQCIGYFGTDGSNAQYIFLKGSAFNKDSAGTNIVNSEIRVNGGNNLATQSRGLCLVTLNRQTLAVVDSATIYDTYEGTTGKNNLITKLKSLVENVFVCLVSYDAIGWSDTLISLLQTFGMSDLPYTSANRYPFLFIGHKNLGKGNGITRMNDMAEPAIPVELGVYVANGALSVKDGKNGEDGDDAVTYQIVYSEAWAKVNSSNIISARLRGHAYKIVGSTRTAMAGATIMMGYVLNNTSSQYPNIETTTDANGYFSENDWFNGDEYGSSGYVQGSQVIFAAIVVNNIVKCVEYITMTLAGAKGDTGRMYYIAGEFPKKAPYTRTDKLCPVVYYATEWWYLDAASATGSDTPSDSSNKWKKIANFGVVLTDAIFVKNFAQFGSAIITGDWLISVHGMIGNTFYGGSVENPDEYQGRAAYTYFDPAYPWGYDPFQLPVTNEEIETNKLTSWTRITDNFKLPAGTYTFNITCYANSSDTLHLRLFYGDESADDLYLGSTGSDEAVTLTFTKTLTSKSDWNVRATMEASGEIGYIVSVEVAPNDARFIPNYAVDLRTGRTYQSDANIKGSIQCIGPTSKVMIEDGVIRFFGSLSFPNIVLGVNEDGCAVLNFYDKNGNFKYGLGPDEIFRTKSQAESMTLKFYNVDAGSNDCTSLTNAEVVMLYLYMFKNQLTNDLVNRSLYKYLAKIASGVYGPGDYCASSADAQKYNEKIIKYGYSASAKLKDSDVYTFGGIVVTTGRTTSGIINKLSYMLNGETVDELDYRGYNVMQDSDFNKTKEGTTYYYRTKDTYNPVQAFYWDSSFPSSSPGGIGYESGYSDKYYLNLCTNPADDDTLIDPVYYFNLMLIDSNGNNKGFKTLYINRKKLSDILQAAGKSL